MPGAASTRIAGAAFLIGGAVAGPAGGWAIQAGVSLLIAGAMGDPSMPGALREVDGRQVAGVDPLAPWRYVYGSVRLGGPVTFGCESGTGESTYLNLYLTLAAHQVQSITDVYLDGEHVPLDGSGDATGKFAGHVHCEFNLGLPNQAAIAGLISASLPQWLLINAAERGIRLNGFAHYLSSASNTALRPAVICVEARIRLHAVQAGVLVAMGAGAQWKLEVLADRTVKFTDAASATVTSATALSLQTETHVAFVGTGAYRRIYLDGVQDANVAAAYSGGAGSGALTVGSLDGASEFAAADIDNLRVWSVERSAADILANVSAELTAQAGLVGSWNFNEGSGATAADSSASALDLTLQPLWTSAHQQKGRAGAWVRLKWNRDLFPNGRPQRITFDVLGKLVLDPRTAKTVSAIDAGTDTLTSAGHGMANGTPVKMHSPDGVLDSGLAEDTEYYVVNTAANTFKLAALPGGSAINLQGDGTGTCTAYPLAYSNNAALCCADLMMDRGKGPWASAAAAAGPAARLAEIDLTQLAAAANVCDEPVTLLDTTTESRYTCNGSFTVDRTPRDFMEPMLTSMAGRWVGIGGPLKLYPGAYIVPTITLDEDDCRDIIEVPTKISRADNFNAVKGVFVSPDNDWQPTDYPPIINSTYEAEDADPNGVPQRIWAERDFPFTTSDSMAQRLAKIALERQRQQIMVHYPAKLLAYRLAPPDTVGVTNAQLGWSAKAFEVVQGKPAVDPGGDVGYDLLLRETASAVYDWTAAGDETQLDPAPNTNLPSVTRAFAPTGLALASGTAQLDVRLDGTIFSRIQVTWEAPADLFVTQGGRIEIEYKKSSASDWNTAPSVDGSQTATYILDVLDGVAYDVRVRSRNAVGVASPWVTVTGHTVVGKTAAPADVTGLVAVQNGDLGVTMDWNDVADLDLAGYEIRAHAQGTPVWANGWVVVDLVRTNSMATFKLPDGAYTLLVKAVDTSGNKSATAASVDLTVTTTTSAVSDDPQEPAWAGTLSNCLVHHTGKLAPTSQTLAQNLGWEVFDEFTPDAYATSTYTAPEVDAGAVADLLLNMTIAAALGPGETIDPDFTVELRIDPDGLGYDAWGTFIPGTYTCRKYQFRFVATNGDGQNAYFSAFRPVSKQPAIFDSGSLTAAGGGTAVVYNETFLTAPNVTVHAQTTGYGYPTAVTSSGFTAHLGTNADSDAGGAVRWEAKNY